MGIVVSAGPYPYGYYGGPYPYAYPYPYRYYGGGGSDSYGGTHGEGATQTPRSADAAQKPSGWESLFFIPSQDGAYGRTFTHADIRVAGAILLLFALLFVLLFAVVAVLLCEKRRFG